MTEKVKFCMLPIPENSFKSLQDGEYFDSMDHASGNLTTKLAKDAPNIRAAIDQRYLQSQMLVKFMKKNPKAFCSRLADAVQAMTSILIGICVAFYYSPKMAALAIVTTPVLMLCQIIIVQNLKKQSEKDEMLTREPLRVIYLDVCCGIKNFLLDRAYTRLE